MTSIDYPTAHRYTARALMVSTTRTLAVLAFARQRCTPALERETLPYRLSPARSEPGTAGRYGTLKDGEQRAEQPARRERNRVRGLARQPRPTAAQPRREDEMNDARTASGKGGAGCG